MAQYVRGNDIQGLNDLPTQHDNKLNNRLAQYDKDFLNLLARNDDLSGSD